MATLKEEMNKAIGEMLKKADEEGKIAYERTQWQDGYVTGLREGATIVAKHMTKKP